MNPLIDNVRQKMRFEKTDPSYIFIKKYKYSNHQNEMEGLFFETKMFILLSVNNPLNYGFANNKKDVFLFNSIKI